MSAAHAAKSAEPGDEDSPPLLTAEEEMRHQRALWINRLLKEQMAVQTQGLSIREIEEARSRIQARLRAAPRPQPWPHSAREAPRARSAAPAAQTARLPSVVAPSALNRRRREERIQQENLAFLRRLEGVKSSFAPRGRPPATMPPKIDKSKYGEEAYKAAGSPMFGKLWSYKELETVERPASLLGRSRGRKCVQRDFKRPDNWPADTEVEPKTWVSWLPDGWAQGIRTQALSGKKLSCYMNPQGKRYWHKKDIEKVLGYMLNPKPVEDDEPEEEKTKKIRYVTDPDAIPNWPEDEDDWLPKDWKLAFRQLPSGLHRVFVPPGFEDEGFLYHRTTVMQWLSGEISNVSPFGTSKPMAEISAAAAERDGSTSKKKRRRSDEPKVAEPKDFEEVGGLGVVRLEGADHLEALRRANVQGAEKLAADAQRLREILSSRHLEDTSLLYVFQSGEQHPVSIAVVGFYYKRPAAWNDRDAYQKILLAPGSSAQAACSGLHVCWSLCWEGHWKIGSLGSDLLGRGYAAICQDSSMQTGWKLLRADLLQSPEAAKAAKTE